MRIQTGLSSFRCSGSGTRQGTDEYHDIMNSYKDYCYAYYSKDKDNETT